MFYLGDLGSGKTKFAEGFLTFFGLEDEISSPTFTIVNEYTSKDINIYHFDVYRLSDIDEFYAIGGTEYFVMSNAPLASANNDTGTVTTLVNVPASFFFKTEEEAEANPAAQIYLERAAAKVTVTESVSCSPKKVLGNSYIEFETSDMAFAIDNYNTSSYLTRHFNSEWLSYNAA